MKLIQLVFAFLLAIMASVKAQYQKLAVALFVASPMLARAQVEGTDIAPVVVVILASIALIVLIGNATLLVRVALRTYGWLRAALR